MGHLHILDFLFPLTQNYINQFLTHIKKYNPRKYLHKYLKTTMLKACQNPIPICC